MTVTKRDRLETAAVLQRLITAVRDGALDADGPAGAGLLKRMQGAREALALKELGARPQDRV